MIAGHTHKPLSSHPSVRLLAFRNVSIRHYVQPPEYINLAIYLFSKRD
jgi:hypothetical protein